MDESKGAKVYRQRCGEARATTCDCVRACCASSVCLGIFVSLMFCVVLLVGTASLAGTAVRSVCQWC